MARIAPTDTGSSDVADTSTIELGPFGTAPDHHQPMR
jgi:hypothetical protein